MTVEAGYVRPSWREVNIDLLARRMYAAHSQHSSAYVAINWQRIDQSRWLAAAEAAVEMIVDEPEREFHASMQAVLNQPVTESRAAREWREAKASDWLPTNSQTQESNS